MQAEWNGARLKELRNTAGLTQPELAEKAGFTKSAIADLESGRRKPLWETVLKLAAALNVDCSAFQEPATEEKPAKKAGKRKK